MMKCLSQAAVSQCCQQIREGPKGEGTHVCVCACVSAGFDIGWVLCFMFPT